MFHHISIIIVSIVLFATFTHCKSLYGRSKNQQLIQAQDAANAEFQLRELLEFYQVSKRARRTFTAKQRKFQHQMLKAHNAYRTKHCARPLELDDDLNRSAQKYAEKIAAMDQMVHSHTPGLGENLYWAWSSDRITSVNGELIL
jgi:uncharacterized protein YkwD